MDVPRLTLRAALAADRLEEFVRQEQARGTELRKGSEFERALALLQVRMRRGPGRELCLTAESKEA
jgi:hypothetical protein